MSDIANFLNPKTIAIVGVSRNREKVGRIIYDALVAKNKKVFGINSHLKFIGKNKIFSSITNIKEYCDLVVYAVPADAVLVEIETAAKIGLKNHLIISAGFEESGPIGLRRSENLLTIINKYHLRVQGPNCLGNISPGTNTNISFGPTVLAGNIGVISQSGAVGTSFLDWSKKEGFGISHFISLGNKIDLSENEFLSFLGQDKDTKAIGMYLESVTEGGQLMEIAKKITKPIVILKAGKTEEAKIAVSSHTGVLAGSFAAQHAAFKQANIIEADSLEEFFNLLKILSFEYKKLYFDSSIILTNAGGPGVLAVDILAQNNFPLTSLSKKIKIKLKSVLPEAASVNNPIDLLGDSDIKRFADVLRVLTQEFASLLLLVILTPQEDTDLMGICEALIKYKNSFPGLLMVNIIGGQRSEAPLRDLAQNQIPAFSFFEDSVACLVKIKTYQEKISSKTRSMPANIKITISEATKKRLAKKILAQQNFLDEDLVLKIAALYKFPLPKTQLTNRYSQVKEFAEKSDFPLVLKVSSPQIIHRNKEGGVFLDIKSISELEIKYNILSKLSQNIVVQEMVQPDAEIIIGAKRDPDFDYLLMFGSGGIHTEYLKDINFAVLPFNYDDMLELIENTKIASQIPDKRIFWPIFSSLVKLLNDFPQIDEVDLNPVVLGRNKLSCIDIKIKI